MEKYRQRVHKKLDEILQLRDKGLRSTILIAPGYRDIVNECLMKLK